MRQASPSQGMRVGVSVELHVYPGAYHRGDAFNPTATSTASVRTEPNQALRRAFRLG